ncbi:MAG: DUF3048 domain-containing protein [Oscillospiraceae bacterium]
MKKFFSLFLALTLVLSMAACSGGADSSGTVPVTAPSAKPQDTPAPEAENTPEPEPTPEATEKPVLYRNFFNGEPLDEPDYSRPICVMFNNHPDALPQCGVGDADIIYEIMTESITRMMAVFSSIEDVGELGSIRSSRPPFVELSQSYGAIYVHAGGSEDAYSMLRSVDNIDGVRGSYPITVFYRNPDRVNVAQEHKLFATSDKISECIEALGYEQTLPEDYSSGLLFTEDGTPAGGRDASKLSVTFGTYAGKWTYFNYDEDSGSYHVYQQNRDYIDGNSGEIVDFRNVLVLSTAARIYDSMGHVSVDLTSGGKGVFACGGQAVDITWSRNDDGTFHYELTDGTPLELGVGRTYVCIISSYDGSVTIE